MRKKFVFATNNSHKLEEVTAILGEKVELLSMKDIKCDTDIPETADTLEGNALLKARYIFDNYHLDCFADDTGLEVEALGGAPGVYSARYAGDAHNSEANMKKLLKDMEGIENRKAQFRTVFALIIDGKEHLFEGIVKGERATILGEKVELLSMKDIKCDTDIPETADTLEGNALLKARYIFDNYHLDCFADDTGLEVEALGGAPGVYSARYAGDAHNSEANMKKLLKDMEGIENRKAQFRTVFALIIDGKEHLFEGIVKGEITKNRKGASGFGYDPIFIPEGYTQTFAEMGNELKNKISHRALATNKLCKFLMR